MIGRTQDPVSGDVKWSPFFIIFLGLVLTFVAVLAVYYMVYLPKQRLAPTSTAGITMTRSMSSLGSVPSEREREVLDQEYAKSLEAVVGSNQVRDFLSSDYTEASLTNVGSRFDRDANSRRLSQLVGDVDTQGSAFYAPSGASSRGLVGDPNGGSNGGFVGDSGYLPGQFPGGRPGFGSNASGAGAMSGSSDVGGSYSLVVNPFLWDLEASGSSALGVSSVGNASVEGDVVDYSDPSSLSVGDMGLAGMPTPEEMMSQYKDLVNGGSGEDKSSVSQTQKSVRELEISANSVPTGTRLNVILLSNVRSGGLAQRVWAVLAQPLVFRNQVQLPGPVLIGGWAGSLSFDQLDVEFDLMVFPDGTELPFSGIALNAFNPLYPGYEDRRGLVDKYVEPPLWTEFLPILIQFGIGATEIALPGNQLVTEGDSRTANSSERMNQGVNQAMSVLQEKVLQYLSRYTPYVELRKGLPFKIELLSTVDFSARALGGYTYGSLKGEIEQANSNVLERSRTGQPSAADFLMKNPDARSLVKDPALQGFVLGRAGRN